MLLVAGMTHKRHKQHTHTHTGAFQKILADIYHIVSNKALEGGGDGGAAGSTSVGGGRAITVAPTDATTAKGQGKCC